MSKFFIIYFIYIYIFKKIFMTIIIFTKDFTIYIIMRKYSANCTSFNII